MALDEATVLADELAKVARQLHELRTVADTLGAIVSAAASLIPGAEMAAIGHREGRAVVPSVQTEDLITVIDQLQTDLGEGPCLAVLGGAEWVVVDDLTVDGRWPRFGVEAARRQVRSALSYRLSVGETTLGNLSMFARSPGAFGEESIAVGSIFASHASIALSGADREAHLSAALATRDVIGQAKGILMERHGLSDDEAFAALARLSQTRHLKLLEVAASVVRSVPPPAAPPSG